jgi:AraC-like DNA-binding protein
VHVILERHGFTNYKLFRRMFQEHFGCTPTKVRENMKK